MQDWQALVDEAQTLEIPYSGGLSSIPSVRRKQEETRGAYWAALFRLARAAREVRFDPADYGSARDLALIVRAGRWEGRPVSAVLAGLNRGAIQAWGPFWPQAGHLDTRTVQTLHLPGGEIAWIGKLGFGYAGYGICAPWRRYPLRGAVVATGELGDKGWWEGEGGERAREWLARMGETRWGR